MGNEIKEVHFTRQDEYKVKAHWKIEPSVQTLDRRSQMSNTKTKFLLRVKGCRLRSCNRFETFIEANLFTVKYINKVRLQ